MRDLSGRKRTVVLLVVALGAALIAEVLVTVTTAFIPSADDFYGAPLPVGFSCFDIPLMRCPTTFSSVLFTFNVLITWIGWVVLARWSGILGIVAALVGSLISLLLIPVGLGYKLPVVGLPLPLLPHTPVPNAQAIWLDTVFWAVAASALVHVIRRRRVAAR